MPVSWPRDRAPDAGRRLDLSSRNGGFIRGSPGRGSSIYRLSRINTVYLAPRTAPPHVGSVLQTSTSRPSRTSRASFCQALPIGARQPFGMNKRAWYLAFGMPSAPFPPSYAVMMGCQGILNASSPQITFRPARCSKKLTAARHSSRIVPA
jgi:hypothetical protein